MKRILFLSNVTLNKDKSIPKWVDSRARISDMVFHAGDFGSKDAFIKFRDSWIDEEGETKLVAVKGDEDLWVEKEPDIKLKLFEQREIKVSEKVAPIIVGLMHNPFDSNTQGNGISGKWHFQRRI